MRRGRGATGREAGGVGGESADRAGRTRKNRVERVWRGDLGWRTEGWGPGLSKITEAGTWLSQWGAEGTGHPPCALSWWFPTDAEGRTPLPRPCSGRGAGDKKRRWPLVGARGAAGAGGSGDGAGGGGCWPEHLLSLGSHSVLAPPTRARSRPCQTGPRP